MKKVLLSTFVIAGLLATSCKKERTCTCTTTSAGISISASATIKDTKKKAKETCDKGDMTYTDGFGDAVTVNCEID